MPAGRAAMNKAFEIAAPRWLWPSASATRHLPRARVKREPRRPSATDSFISALSNATRLNSAVCGEAERDCEK